MENLLLLGVPILKHNTVDNKNSRGAQQTVPIQEWCLEHSRLCPYTGVMFGTQQTVPIYRSGVWNTADCAHIGVVFGTQQTVPI